LGTVAPVRPSRGGRKMLRFVSAGGMPVTHSSFGTSPTAGNLSGDLKRYVSTCRLSPPVIIHPLDSSATARRILVAAQLGLELAGSGPAPFTAHTSVYASGARTIRQSSIGGLVSPRGPHDTHGAARPWQRRVPRGVERQQEAVSGSPLQSQ
jgi:hypothetical protein